MVIIDSDEVDDLIKQGKIAGDTRVDIVRVGIGAGVREGAPKPDISSVDAFKNTLLNVKSFTYAPQGSTGRHLPKVFDRLGIAEQVKGKISQMLSIALRRPSQPEKSNSQLGVSLHYCPRKVCRLSVFSRRGCRAGSSILQALAPLPRNRMPQRH